MRARAVCAVALWAALALPAGAELEWVPEGQFYVDYAFPLAGEAPAGPDRNFNLVVGRLGTRLLLAPGLSLRAVGELVADPARRAGDLRVGYAEYLLDPLGTVRAGQVPLLGDLDDRLTGDPILGPGLLSRAGFFTPGGLGGSWLLDFPIEVGTASTEVAVTYTEGLLGTAGWPDSSRFVGVKGPGQAVHARVGLASEPGWFAHLMGRYGIWQDQQIAASAGGRLFELDWLGVAGASVSNPAGLPAAADAALQAQVRYNLRDIDTRLWRTDLVLRGAAISRNFTGTPTVDPRFPEATPRTDLRSTVGIVQRITDFTAAAVDLTEERALWPAAPPTLFLGLRAGVGF